MKKINPAAFLFLPIVIFYNIHASYIENNMYPFSFDELQAISFNELQKPCFLTASDGISLAYYPFITNNPIAVIIFYHGAGLYSNKSYQWIASELQKTYHISCYMVDVRGHGNSGGPRGDTPTIEQVWQDVDTIIEKVKIQYQNIPVYLVGHSSGSGLLINYNAYGKATNAINGYIFLAPYLGPQSGTLKEHKDSRQSFVKKARIWVYILNNLISWNLLQHIHAIFFNYPSSLLNEDPLIISSYSYAMSCATTPYETQKLFAQIHKPYALYIGEDDEQFLPHKIVEYKNENSIAEIIPKAKHLSILLDAPELIAKTIRQWNFNKVN